MLAQTTCLDGAGPLTDGQSRCDQWGFLEASPILDHIGDYDSVVVLRCGTGGAECLDALKRYPQLGITITDGASCSISLCAFIEFHDKDYWWAYRVDDDDKRWIEQSEFELHR